MSFFVPLQCVECYVLGYMTAMSLKNKGLYNLGRAVGICHGELAWGNDR